MLSQEAITHNDDTCVPAMMLCCCSSSVHSPAVSVSPERVTSGVSPLRAQASPSRSPCSSRPLSMVASPQSHSSHQSSPLSPASGRPLVPLTSAAAAITPPNMSAAHLNGGDAPVCLPSSPAHAHTAITGFHKLEEKKVSEDEITDHIILRNRDTVFKTS